MKSYRKFLSFLMLVIVATVACVFCGCSPKEDATQLSEPEVEEPIQTDGVEILSIDEIEAMAEKNPEIITVKQARELCAEVLGEYGSETGFPISYRCEEAIAIDGKIYYVMNMAWLVDNSHWSHIGECFVNIDGKEIYNGSAFNGEYEITERIWPD